jgi:HK97 family phage portal protein
MLENIKGLFTPKLKTPDAPIWNATGNGYGRLLPEWNIGSAVEAYERNPIVYACVRLIATELANAAPRVFSKRGTDKGEMTDHPLIKLLNHPNPFQSGHELMEGIATWLELAGECPVYLNLSANGEPVEMYILDPRFLTVIPDAKKYVSGYLYKAPSGEEISFTPDEIVLFRDFNPKSQYRGHAPIRSARYVVDSDQYQEEYNRDFFGNDALPRAVLTTPSQLPDNIFNRLKKMWKETYQGRGKAHQLAILEGGVDVKILQQTAKDMDFAQLGEKNIQRICAAFRVPKALLGIDLDLNRASAETMAYIFARWTIKPKLRMIQEKLNNELLPLYKRGGDYFIRFDDPVSVDPEQKNARYLALSQTGAISPNEIRDEEDLAPVAGGDSPLVSMGLIPLDMVAANASYGMEDLTDIIDDLSADEQKQLRAVKIENRRLEGEGRELVRSVRDSKLRRFEKRYIGRSRAMFETQKKQTLAKLDAYYIGKSAQTRAPSADELFDEQENVQLSVKLFEPLNVTTLKGGAQDTLDLIKDANELDYAKARVAAKNMTMKFARQVSRTTKDKLRKALADSIEAGEGVAKMSDRVKTVFAEASTSRSVLIARTESTKAYSMGAVEGMRQGGVTAKEWLTANDDDVRATHEACEAQGAIALNLAFSNGLEYPADPSGEPDEVCNCRCTLLPVVDQD